MYALTATVQTLCKNRRTALGAEEVETFAGVVESEIDAAISEHYYWPLDANGVDISGSPPAILIQISNLITAGIIEQVSYAQNEAGGAAPNPYGAMLEKRGRSILARICDGSIVIPGLQRITEIIGRASTASTYRPVSGLRGTGSTTLSQRRRGRTF